MKTPLDTLLDELAENARVETPSLLYFMSNLDGKEMKQVRAAWPNLPTEARRDLVTRLVEIAEADFEVNFGQVFRLALDDESGDVRVAAVEGLWEESDVRLVSPLVARLTEDEDAAVRAKAASLLGHFILLGELGKIRPGPSAEAYQALLASFQNRDEHGEVRRRALESLAYAGEQVVADLILEAFTAAEEKMRISAVFAMGRSADPRWCDHVRQEVYSANPELRYEAARACGELQIVQSVPEMEELAEDVDPEVQEAALWALGQIGGEKARAILERYCLAENEATQMAAQEALEELEFMHGDLADLINRLADEGDW